MEWFVKNNKAKQYNKNLDFPTFSKNELSVLNKLLHKSTKLDTEIAFIIDDNGL